MFLALTKGNVIAALQAAPNKELAYSDLLQKFENFESRQVQVELLAFLWSMRGDPGCPLWFEGGWITHTEIVVCLKE